jgi:mannonate dehydratase
VVISGRVLAAGRCWTRRRNTRLSVAGSSPNKRGTWGGLSWKEPLSHGRVFTKDEIRENYTHFIKQLAPVAEEVGVRIGIHPDDPPVPVLAGVPRCIFSNYRRVQASPGNRQQPERRDLSVLWYLARRRPPAHGEGPGRDDPHVRRGEDLENPLPHFVETFMYNLYYDIYKTIKVMRDVNYDGIVILDHSPGMVGGQFAQTAYGFAYMRALLNRANAEAKG